MPIYEFQCQDCAERFDELIGSREKEVKVNCPGCRSNHVQRLMSAFGFSSGAKTVSSGSSSCDSCAGGNCSNCH